MKITICGFRCYKTPTTFEFQDDGTILLSGPSGVGKSTILMAINYALYGGSIDISYGETKCRVEFEFKGLKIVRSKPPNRLIVNDIYEDTVAQQMIYDVYGKNFDITGYIPQNTNKSFLKQGAPQKREFLESVQFESLHLSEKKEKLDNIIKINKQELDKTIGKVEMAKSMLPEKPAEVVFPLKSNDYEMTSRNQRVKLKNIETKYLVVKRKEIKNKEAQLSALRVVNAQISGKDETINQISSQMADMSITLKTDSEDFIGEDRLMQYQKQLQKIKNNTQLQRLIHQRDADQEKMENMKTTEMAELSQNIATIQMQLWVEYSKDETLELIQSNKELLVDITKITSLKNKKVTLKDDLPTLESRKDKLAQSIEDVKGQLQSVDVLSCPSCQANVLLEKGKLVPSLFSSSSVSASAVDLRKQLQVLSGQLKQVEYDIIKFGDVTAKNEALDAEIDSIVSQYEEELSDESEVKELVAQMESYYNTQIVLEKKLYDAQRRIQMELFSPSYQSCKQSLEKLKLQIESLECSDDCDGDDVEDEETIREMITTHQQKLQRIRQTKKQLSLQDETKKKLLLQREQHRLEFVSKYEDDDDEETLVTSIKVLKEEVKELEKNANEHRQNIANIDLYLEYKKNEAFYNSHLETIRTLEKQQEVDSEKYTLAKILKNDFMDVEHIALTNTVNDINAYANVLLQEFFDDTIFVNLSCFKEDKKKNEKPQINIDIKYRDKNCTLGSLSGGEYARVNLAFTLSLALIFKTPLLLLDETLSSLDEDASDVVFASIKKHFKNIPVITILHQVTSEGDFDQVIKL